MEPGRQFEGLDPKKMWINTHMVEGTGSKKDRKRWQVLHGGRVGPDGKPTPDAVVLSEHRTDKAAVDAYDRHRRGMS